MLICSSAIRREILSANQKGQGIKLSKHNHDSWTKSAPFEPRGWWKLKVATQVSSRHPACQNETRPWTPTAPLFGPHIFFRSRNITPIDSANQLTPQIWTQKQREPYPLTFPSVMKHMVVGCLLVRMAFGQIGFAFSASKAYQFHFPSAKRKKTASLTIT